MSDILHKSCTGITGLLQATNRAGPLGISDIPKTYLSMLIKLENTEVASEFSRFDHEWLLRKAVKDIIIEGLSYIGRGDLRSAMVQLELEQKSTLTQKLDNGEHSNCCLQTLILMFC